MFAMKENVKPDNSAAISATTSESNFHSSPRNSASPNIPSSGRPNSHHRRRSSVSTRRESAEMMGLPTAALNELPTQDEADTDSIRRNTLWALEGRFESDAFSKVQIPELSRPVSESKMDLGHSSLKNPFQHISSLAIGGKRDSTGRSVTICLSSKDQLHTLVEEEEEDDDEEVDVRATKEDDNQPTEVLSNSFKGATSLKPLHLPSARSESSSPAATRNGLKPLTLATSPVISSAGSLSFTKGSLNQVNLPARRSSLSYKRSSDTSSTIPHVIANPLPTPELTPVTAERPLSPSEQAFLSSNQTSLLSRISELERVLAVRSRSMSTGTSSSRQHSISSQSSEGPSDEMLCLVRDLKMERDDLKRDLASWRIHITDLEGEIDLLTQRVEKERYEAWRAKEELNTLEMERATLKRDLNSATSEIKALQSALATATDSMRQATASFEIERTLRLEAEREVMMLNNLQANRSQSIGSSTSSTTYCESELITTAAGLKTVLEEDENTNSEDEDELAHYEDENDDDLAIYSDDSFSDRSTGPSLLPVVPRTSFNTLTVPSNATGPLASPSSAASPTPPCTPQGDQVVHARRSSLEQNWSFPKGAQPKIRQAPDVDRFFDCLELVDPPVEALPTGIGFHQGKDKYGFIRDDEEFGMDDDVPFVIPAYAEDTALKAFQPEDASPFLQPRISNGNEDGPIDSQSSIECVTPRSVALWTTPRLTGLQTPRKLPPSSIPRLSPSPKKLGTSLPITPISNPRSKGISDISRTPLNGRKIKQTSPTTPTKVSRGNEPRKSGTAYPGPSSSSSSTTLKTTGMAALANYLPWAGWAQSDTSDRIRDDPRVANSQSLSSHSLAHPSTATSALQGDKLIPSKRLPTVSQLKRPDKLFLL